jgi:hypothetical protein
MKFFAAALAFLLLALPVAGMTQVPVKGILAAQRFTLAEPYEDNWSPDNAKIASGTLLVLDVDPKLVAPREALNSVLYVGGRPVRRLNRGDLSGHVLVIVPSSIDVAAPMWLGAPDVPEALTTGKIQAEKAKAGRAFASKALERAPQRPAVEAQDLAALLRDVAAPLIDQFSPQDAQIAAQWRLPEGR